MLVTIVAATLARDLRTLRREVEAYPDETLLWQTVPGISNPAGTLALHLAGNIQHYVGKQLGGTSYVRDRPAEFSRRNVPRAEILAEISAAERATTLLERVEETTLERDFPETIGGSTLQTGDFLLHLVAHLNFHVGQIDYHRRVVTGENASVRPVPVAELSSARAK
jgi:hypothetical protein